MSDKAIPSDTRCAHALAMTIAQRIKPMDYSEDDLRIELASIDEELAQLKADRARVVLEETLDALRRHDDKITTASRRAEQTRARLEVAQTRANELRAASDEEERRQRYDAALAIVQAAEADLAATYPALISEFRGLLRRVAEAELAREAANAALPSGMAPIPSVEHFRHEPGAPAKVISRERVWQWCNLANGRRLDDSLQGDVVSHETSKRLNHVKDAAPNNERRGVVSHSSGNRTECVLREFERVEIMPEIKGRVAKSIVDAALPGLMVGDQAGWPGLKGHNPRAVLKELDRLEQQPEFPRSVPSVRVEYVAVKS